MHSILSLNPTVGFAGGLLLAFAILGAFEFYNTRRVTKITTDARKKAETEADKIIDDARHTARKMLTDAETATIALTGTRKQEDASAEHAYEVALSDMLQKLQGQIEQGAKVAFETQHKILELIASQLEAEGKQAQVKLSESVAKLEKEYEGRIEAQIAAAFAAAKEEATNYENARKAAVDAHIAALVAETMRLVLQQNLPKEIHADLLKTALEEAKASGVF